MSEVQIICFSRRAGCGTVSVAENLARQEIMKSPNTTSPRSAVTALCATLLLAGFSGPALASPLQNAIAAAEQQFGGEAFEAERYREGGRTYIEVEVLSGNQIVEAEFRGNGNRLIDAETYGNPRRIARLGAALDRAELSLAEAVQIAEDAIGPGRVEEAKLRITRKPQRNGTRFIVEVRTEDGLFDVVINSRNGRVIRIRPD